MAFFPKGRKTWRGGHFICSLLLLLLASCLQDHEEWGDSTTLVKVGDTVPAFVLSASDGEVISSDSLKGQVYVLNFFDTGCPDCREELQVLQQVYDNYRGNVPIFNVPRSQTRDEVAAAGNDIDEYYFN